MPKAGIFEGAAVADFLGISLGRQELAMALLTRAGRELTLRESKCIEYGEAGLDAAGRAAFAARAVADGPHARVHIAIALPGEEVFLRPHVVPFTKRSHIARTLHFEMEDKLPFEVSSGVLDFTITGVEPGGSRILVAAIEREKLMSVVEPFRARGLRVRLVTIDVLVAGGLRAFGFDGRYTLLEVTSFGWKLALCEEGRVLFARAAPAAPAAESVEQSLARWVRQGFMAAPEGLEPAKVVLCGAAAAHIDSDRLSSELSLEVERLSLGATVPRGERTREPEAAEETLEPFTPGPADEDIAAPEQADSLIAAWGQVEEARDEGAQSVEPGSEGETPDEEPASVETHFEAGAGGQRPEAAGTGEAADAGSACAVGALLAAAELAGGSSGIDLLRAATGEKKLSEALFGPLAAALVLLSALCAMVGLGAWRSAAQARAEEQAVRRSEMSVWRELFPDRDPPGGSVCHGLQGLVRELRESGGLGALGGDADWLLKALYVLSSNVPEGVEPTFTGFDVAAGKLTIRVSSRETASAYEIAEGISAEGSFEAEPKDLKTGEGGESTYTIVMMPKGGV